MDPPKASGPDQFESTDDFISLEILDFETNCETRQGYVVDSEIGAWLKGLSSSSDSAPAPKAGFRLLVAKYQDKDGDIQLSFTPDALNLIDAHFQLPELIRDLISGPGIHSFKYSIASIGLESPRPGFFFRTRSSRNTASGLTCLEYNPKTNLTTALLLIRDYRNTLNSFIHELAQLVGPPGPLFLPIRLSRLALRGVESRIAIGEKELNRLTERIGQHDFHNRPKGNPLELDFLATTTSLNWIADGIARSVLWTKGIRSTLSCVCEWSAVIGPVSSPDADLDKIPYLEDLCRAILDVADYNDKRAKALIQVVYQFMAERSAQTNLDMLRASRQDSATMKTIAIETKRDSSAMKAIALLGMFFLPGTAVAAIFAMPVLNWDGNGPVLTENFRYYWEITLPLTFVIMTSWFLAVIVPWGIVTENFPRRMKIISPDVEETVMVGALATDRGIS